MENKLLETLTLKRANLFQDIRNTIADLKESFDEPVSEIIYLDSLAEEVLQLAKKVNQLKEYNSTIAFLKGKDNEKRK